MPLPYAEITPHDLEAWRAQGAQLIDVREPWEFARGHIPGARNLPLGALPHRLADLDPERPIVFICASGNRSGQAAQLLTNHGYRKVANLVGGTLAWQRNGLLLAA